MGYERHVFEYVDCVVKIPASVHCGRLKSSSSVVLSVLPVLLAGIGVGVTGASVVVASVARTSTAHTLASFAAVSVTATKRQQTASIGVGELFESVCAFTERLAIRSIGETAAIVRQSS